MGPWGPKMGVPPKKAPILRKMPFRVSLWFYVYGVSLSKNHKVPPHDDVVVVV